MKDGVIEVYFPNIDVRIVFWCCHVVVLSVKCQEYHEMHINYRTDTFKPLMFTKHNKTKQYTFYD